jgi:hypothetical protein
VWASSTMVSFHLWISKKATNWLVLRRFTLEAQVGTMTLQNIKNELESVKGLSVSQRGTGKGTFLFVRSSRRAIEVYIEDIGYVVECWNSPDEESDDACVSRDVFASDSEALAKIRGWLCST